MSTAASTTPSTTAQLLGIKPKDMRWAAIHDDSDYPAGLEPAGRPASPQEDEG